MSTPIPSTIPGARPAPAELAKSWPLVSIIIPVYNRFQYVTEAIDSALAQTTEGEVIVIDDGSKSDVRPILAPYGERVQFYRKANGGLASARNLGIERAHGEYLLFLDDDDFLEPDAVQTLLGALLAEPGAVWAAGKYSYVDADGKPTSKVHAVTYSSGDVYRRMMFNNLMGAPSVVLARRDAIRAMGCFDESFLLSEDWDMWLALARDYPLVAVDKRVSNYRVHGQQISGTQWTRHMEYHVRVLQKHRAKARPGTAALFDRGIAELHRKYGDRLYVAGEHSAARVEWKQAALGGALKGWALQSRLAKSHLPYGVTEVLRSIRKRM
jgi:glycosyltransferase involved in cell wall biosynthesis